ncbi:MAG: CDP-alcohol phosphatidyltransferase family protein [Thermoguttaceae bacterium]
MTEQTSDTQPRLWNVPNILTMLRILLAVVIFALFPFRFYRVCLVLFIIAALTDFLDGWWARKYDQKTQFGRIMDPFADKALVCGTFICMVSVPLLHDLFDCASSTSSCPFMRLPIGLASWMVIAIVLRELFVTMLRAMVESSGGDFSAKWVGKWKTGLQCVDLPLGFLILIFDERGAVAPLWLRIAFVACLYVVVYLTLYSGWIYIRAAMSMNKQVREVIESPSKD